MNSYTTSIKNPTLKDLGSELGFAKEWTKNKEYELRSKGLDNLQIYQTLKLAYHRLDQLSYQYGRMKNAV